MIATPDMKTLAIVASIPLAIGILFNVVLYVTDPAGLKNDPQICKANPAHIYCR